MRKIDLGKNYGIEAEFSGEIENGRREVVGCVTFYKRPIFDICAGANEAIAFHARTRELGRRHRSTVIRLILDSTDANDLLFTIRRGVREQIGA